MKLVCTLIVAFLSSASLNVGAFSARRVLEHHDDTFNEVYNFIVSQASPIGQSLCLAATHGTKNAASLGLETCDFTNAPPEQLWTRAGSKIASDVGNGIEKCMMVNHGTELFDGVRIRLGDCDDSQTDFTFDGTFLKVFVPGDNADTTEFCLTSTGVTANVGDKILAKSCEDRADFKWIITENGYDDDTSWGRLFELFDTNSFGCVQPKKTGGMPVKGDDIIVDDCDSTRAWYVKEVDGAVIFSSAVDTKMCMQAGYGQIVKDGTKMRLMPCDPYHPLQRFLWFDFEAPITLEKRNDLCLVSQGGNYAVIGNNLIMKKCSDRAHEWSGDEIY